jgi:hypothetical protein
MLFVVLKVNDMLFVEKLVYKVLLPFARYLRGNRAAHYSILAMSCFF